MTQPDNTVPRDLVWAYARRTGLPRAELIRMGAGRLPFLPPDPRARMPREDAIHLLGEIEVDERWPEWGEHLAYLDGDPDALPHPEGRSMEPVTARAERAIAVWFAGKQRLDAILAP